MNSKLVQVLSGKVVTTSRIVAEFCGKNHQHVMRDIQKLELPDSFRLSNFGQSTFTNSKGKTYPETILTKDGFTILVMGYTGKAAMEWKLKYIAEFNAMEAALLKQNDKLEWKQARIQGKAIRKDFTDTVKTFVDYATAQGSKSAGMYYSNLTKMEYAALGLLDYANKVPDGFRDTLDSMELCNLTLAENVARKAFDAGMNASMNYKDIYQYVKLAVNKMAQGLTLPMIGVAK